MAHCPLLQDDARRYYNIIISFIEIKKRIERKCVHASRGVVMTLHYYIYCVKVSSMNGLHGEK